MRARHNITAWGRPSDRDPTPAPELEQPFVSQDAKSTKHRVCVDAENRGEVAGRRQPFTRPRLAVGDCAPISSNSVKSGSVSPATSGSTRIVSSPSRSA